MKKNPYQQQPEGAPSAEKNESKAAERPVAVDGFKQVLEMLKIADPAFRESLLKRLAVRDVELAATLRHDLRQAGLQ